MRRLHLLLTCLLFATTTELKATSPHSIARIWNEEILAGIRIDLPHPPAHARNLYHLSVCMWDAWAAYEPTAVGVVYRGKHTAADVELARREAISYAAYRILKERYALSRGAATTLPLLDARMALLGYPVGNTVQDGSPAGVGNKVFAAVSSHYIMDGARQLQAYADSPVGAYVSLNLPLLISVDGTIHDHPNNWQPMAITNATTQNGIPADAVQKFLGAHWRNCRPFALRRENNALPWIDPGPPPLLGFASDAEFRDNVVAVIRASSELTPDDGVMVDVSPGALGNNPLGQNGGPGYPLNPATGLPYAPNVVPRGDFARVVAEYWADGPHSETPPGHWNTLANGVAYHPDFSRRLYGIGPVMPQLEWDVKMYVALNAALHDAACAAWTLKRFYDGWRPISVIRYMGQRGQSSFPNDPGYHPDGLPLVPGLIEQVTEITSLPGERHEGLVPYTVAIKAYAGPPAVRGNDYSGVKWIKPDAWFTFQARTFVTPAFPGYVSGHSTFSRSAAEVLTAMTGSPFFPGGMASHTVAANTGLLVEYGPSVAVQLQWATYFDAADQAGISRIWGGIHPPVDDFQGRIVGSQVGLGAWSLIRQYFDGSVEQSPFGAEITRSGTTVTVRCPVVRGLYYKMQSAADLAGPWVDEPGGYQLQVDSYFTKTFTASAGRKFFRAVRKLAP